MTDDQRPAPKRIRTSYGKRFVAALFCQSRPEHPPESTGKARTLDKCGIRSIVCPVAAGYSGTGGFERCSVFFDVALFVVGILNVFPGNFQVYRFIGICVLYLFILYLYRVVAEKAVTSVVYPDSRTVCTAGGGHTARIQE